MLSCQPSQPPGSSQRFTHWDQRPVSPIVYQVPSSSRPLASSPEQETVCSM